MDDATSKTLAAEGDRFHGVVNSAGALARGIGAGGVVVVSGLTLT